MVGEKIKPPDELSEQSKREWAQIVEENAIDLPASKILETLFFARDRRDQARQNIAEHGPLIKDRFGTWKVNPATSIERDSTLIMHRAYRLLGWDQESRGGSDQMPLQY